MTPKKYKVLFSEKIHDVGMAMMAQEAEVFIAENAGKEALLKSIAGMDALIVRSSPLPNEVIEAGTGLKVIGRHGIGVDNIDLPFTASKGISVVNTPTGNVRSVAEKVMTYMLALSNRLLENDRRLREGVFSQPGKSLPGLVTNNGYHGYEISGKTLGVAGFGKIGAKTAAMAINGFEMKVLAYDPPICGKIPLPEGVSWAETLEELCEKSDFISINVPLLESTRNMFGEKQFQLMKKTGCIINCSRGGLIDEDALYKALKSGEIMGAGIDAYAVEPPPADCPLFELDNIVLSPHCAGMTDESLQAMSRELVQGVLDVLGGKTPPNLVRVK